MSARQILPVADTPSPFGYSPACGEGEIYPLTPEKIVPILFLDGLERRDDVDSVTKLPDPFAVPAKPR